MEPKIKTAKELKIKAVEQEQQVLDSANNDPKQTWGAIGKTVRSIPKTTKQLKARAANKRAKKARKVNR